MKKIFTILLTTIASFVLVSVANAQSIDQTIKDPDESLSPEQRTLKFPNQKTNYTIDNSNGKKVAYRKSISEPFSDGTYYIKLETFATGSAQKTIKSTPSDIILILDLSSSMNSNTYTYKGQSMSRLAALRLVIEDFAKTVYDNDAEARSYGSYEGDRIAIIGYNRNANFTSNGWVYINDVVTKTGNDYSGTLINQIRGMNYSSGTRPDHGLDMAITELLSGSAPAQKRANANLTVLLFTDGYPTDNNGSEWGEPTGDGHTDKFENSFANKTLYYGTRLKKEFGAKLFTVGLISHKDRPDNPGFMYYQRNPGDQSQNHDAWENAWKWRNYCRVYQMLDWLSSNYPDSHWDESVLEGQPLAIESESPNHNYYNGYTGTGGVLKGENNIPAPWKNVWNYSADGDAVTLEGFIPGSTTTDGNKFTSEGYCQIVDDNTDFSSIFEAIAQQTAGTANMDLSSSTSNVDIVSNSFKLPDGLFEPGAVVKDYVKVFTAKLQDIDGATDDDQTNGTYNFETEILAPNSRYQYTTYDAQGNPTGMTDIDDAIALQLVDENGIKVVGFDYASNFCGPVYKAKSSSGNREVDHYNGHKIIILIPIKMNPDAVGGPNVVTNADGSGIYTENSGDEPLIEFESPTVSLPVNVYIEKIGLTGRESAKFKIERAIMPDEVDEDWNPATDQSLDWKYVSTVFVTNSRTTEKSTLHTIVVVENGIEKEIQTSGNPMVRIKGMPATLVTGWVNPNNPTDIIGGATKPEDNVHTQAIQVPLIYRISEEPWSWSYDPQTPPQYTVTSKLDNPFTFINKEFENSNNLYLEDHRHAESKVMNIFNTGTNKRFDDSKTNTGRESSGPGGLNTTTNP